MKGLKKIALATAIAAAPFASHAGMKALDDTAMGNVTGQAGVTIELETKIGIGEFRYTDTDGYGTETEGGSFVVSGITLGGAGVAGGMSYGSQMAVARGDLTPEEAVANSGLLDDLAIEIDVAANGDAIIHVASLSKFPTDGSLVGTPFEEFAGKDVPIDWGIDIDEIKLQAAGENAAETTLISGMSGYGYLAKLDIAVRNNDAAATGQTAGTGLLNISTAFNVAAMDFDVDFMGVGIRDLKVSGSLPESGSTGDQVVDAYLSQGYAYVDVNVYSGEAKAAGVNEALNIDVNDVYLDVSIGDILIGNDGTGTGPNLSIGSVALNNVAITDTKLVVYGR